MKNVMVTKEILSFSFITLSFAFFTSPSFAENKAFTESARFERLSHFKDAGLINHLNTVDEAMIADGSCRLFTEEQGGYALWYNRTATELVNNATKDLPVTEKPSHFVLTAEDVLPKICPKPTTRIRQKNDEYSCRGGSHNIDEISTAMSNWQRALCALKDDPAWGGEFDPAYQPQQMVLTAGFMCIVACDCNEKDLPASSLKEFAIDDEHAQFARDVLCELTPWGEVDFTNINSDPNILAELSAPLIELCKCS